MNESQTHELLKKDILAKAKTGTGKTVAFMIPAIERRVAKMSEMPGNGKNRYAHDNVGALVISPTRELAAQIVNEAVKLRSGHPHMNVHLIVGGDSRRNQLRIFQKFTKDIVVATPGRMLDLLRDPEHGDMVRRAVAHTETFILDEADTLLDMGFSENIDDIKAEIKTPPSELQTLLFSATVSKAIQETARNMLTPDHLFIDTVPENESNVHAHIPQYYTVVPEIKDYFPTMLKTLAHDQLINPEKSKTIIFCPTLKLTQLYSTMIRESVASLPHGGMTEVISLHSNLSQGQRSTAANRFRTSTAPASVLVTSDVSARGVDYPGVTRVIQVALPTSNDIYVHRVGRTGRGNNKKGRADWLMMPFEEGILRSFKEIPLKPYTVDELDAEIATKSAEFDAAPPKYLANRSRMSLSNYQHRAIRELNNENFSGRYDKLQDKFDNLREMIDQDAVTETMVSMMGIYGTKAIQLDVPTSEIIDGLKAWAMQIGDLAEPPHVSDALILKAGFPSKRGAYGGSNRGHAGSRGGFGAPAPFGKRNSRPGGLVGRSGGFRPSYGSRDNERSDRSSGGGNYKAFERSFDGDNSRFRQSRAGRSGAGGYGSSPSLGGRRLYHTSAVRRSKGETAKQPTSDLWSALNLDFRPKTGHVESLVRSRPLSFSPAYDQFEGRRESVLGGNVASAYRKLQTRLTRNQIKKTLRLQIRYEKPTVARRRIQSERHRRRFAMLVRSFLFPLSYGITHSFYLALFQINQVREKVQLVQSLQN